MLENNTITQKSIIIIISLMIIAGILGGLTNYFRMWKEEKGPNVFFKNVLMGLSASLLTPLFLNMISSTLLLDSIKDFSKLIVFFGFCLIASLSSKSFIDTISKRILDTANEAKKIAENTEKIVEPIVSKETETEYETEDKSEHIEKSETESEEKYEKDTQKVSGIEIRGFGFDDTSRKVLKNLYEGKYAWRTVTGLAKDSGNLKSEVLNSLEWLLLNRLVVMIKNNKGIKLWGLTAEGKDISDKLFAKK